MMTEQQSTNGRSRRGESPYRLWQQQEGLPRISGSVVPDLHTVEVKPWPRLGQSGAFVNLADQELDDGWVIEIAPGGSTEPIHHAFEMGVFVVDGRGATTLWQTGRPKQTVEWRTGSVFAPPLNCCYQHFNLDGQRPARLFAVTNAPTVINLYRNPEFAFENPFVFADRYDGEADYFVDHGYREANGPWKTNFVPDLRTFRMEDYKAEDERGTGSISMSFALSNNSMAASNTLFPVGSYKKAHRHGVGAHLIILDGTGYSLLWYEGEEPRKIEWKDGTVISPRYMEYHQHFNTGPKPAMYFKFRLSGLDPSYGEWLRLTESGDAETERQGIPYEREDPWIYQQFAQECARSGVEVTLPRPVYVS